MTDAGSRQTVFFGAAAAALIRAIAMTWRTERVDVHYHAEARKLGANIIYAFWHGRLLPLLQAHRNESIHVLASRHRDGERLGQVIRHFGYGHVRGSSTRGGARAIRELAAVIAGGNDIGLTVDGPRGPIHVAKPGAVQVAKLTGAAIIPLTSASVRHREFTSWDRFQLPYPLSRVQVRYGPPLVVPRDADDDTVEAIRAQLEDTLNTITRESDRDLHG
jgi:lysophospholipid acyltransferase (LPLAT)-like uncharacterized protein